MIEKVNPMHLDKIADRIAGAIVDLAYKNEEITAITTLVTEALVHSSSLTSYLLETA